MAAYISRVELDDLGIPSGSHGIAGSTQDAHISASSDLIDGFLRARHTLPLSEVPTIVKMWTAHIATFTMFAAEGMNSENMEEFIANRYFYLIGDGTGQKGLLERLAQGEWTLGSTVDATPSTDEGRPRIYSGRITTADNAELRGWWDD